MNAVYAPNLSHAGVACFDIEKMLDFYTSVFDLRVTDKGPGNTFPFMLAFLSGQANQHHQLALAENRPAGAPSTVLQLSFKVKRLDHLRLARSRALAKGATQMRGLNHGNALSIYFLDPEENTVEVYLDTPWYVSQPHGDPLDLDRADADIWADTERMVRADPSFMLMDEWSRNFGDALKVQQAQYAPAASGPAIHPSSTSTTDLPAFVEQRAAALLARDWASLESLLAKDLCYVHATGVRHNKSEYLDFVKGNIVWDAIHLQDPVVSVTGDVTVVTGRLNQSLSRGDAATPIEATSWVTEVWRKTDSWRLAAFQSTRPAEN